MILVTGCICKPLKPWSSNIEYGTRFRPQPIPVFSLSLEGEGRDEGPASKTGRAVEV